MIDEKEKTLRDFVHEAIVPLIEDVIVKKLYQALEVVASEIKSPRKEWVRLTDEEIKIEYEASGHCQTLRAQDSFAVFSLARAIEAKLKERNTS